MSELTDKQERFMTLLPRLYDFIHSQGYKIRGGELWRPPETAALDAAKGTGIKNSLHTLKLAQDLMLVRSDGVLLEDSEDYRFAGEYWQSLDPDCCWGGIFKDAQGHPKPDGDHFSLQYQGIK